MIKLQSLRATKFKQLEDVSVAFPEQGSVLIQGLNEAGKSTLFEAVFFGIFGRALVTEDNAGKLEDLIQYQMQRAYVELAFSTDTASFVVKRTLNRGKPNTAVLDISYVNGKAEQVTNLTAVNKRIVAELGLDGEALLNSCFVEQKKLEKLEGMNAQQRRDTLLRLLNMDKLGELEQRYKPSQADEYELQQKRDRLSLAEIQRDLPAARHRLAEVDGQLQVVAARKLVEQLVALQQAVKSEQERQAPLEQEQQRLAETVERVDRLKQLRELSKAAGQALQAVVQEEEEIVRVEAEIAELRSRAGELEGLTAEILRLEDAAGRLGEIEALEQEAADCRRQLESLVEAAERAELVRRAIEDREAEVAALDRQIELVRQELLLAEEDERRRRQADALRNWLNVREVASAAEVSERELDAWQARASDLQRDAGEREAEHRMAKRTAAGLAVGVIASLAGAAIGVAAGVLAALGAVVLAAVLAVACRRALLAANQRKRTLVETLEALDGCHMELHRREGARELALRAGQDPGRLAALEAELLELRIQPPGSLDQGQQQLAELEASLKDLDGQASRQRLGALDGQRQALVAEASRLRQQVDAEGDPAGEIAEQRQRLNLLEQRAPELRRQIQADLASVAEARERLAAAKAAERQAREAGQKLAETGTNLTARTERLARLRSEAEELFADLSRLHGEPIERTVESCRGLWRQVSDELAALDEARLKADASQVTQELGASRERVSSCQREIVRLKTELDATGLDPADLPSTSLDEEESLQRERQELFGRIRSLDDMRITLEKQLNLQGVTMDCEESARELAVAEERRAVKQQAYRVIRLARQNIVGKVLPSTTRNMSLLLPLLTNDHYRDVNITEDYKIQVWDETARAMKAKDIFSGGTRDQFSLALRLAFALTTLPEELGTAPGFIFLDEPLSSFDQARAEALVNLLTHGLIAANFQQIFVISHNRSFDDGLFDYHLYLESGRIVASDLPDSATVEETLGQPELFRHAKESRTSGDLAAVGINDG